MTSEVQVNLEIELEEFVSHLNALAEKFKAHMLDLQRVENQILKLDTVDWMDQFLTFVENEGSNAASVENAVNAKEEPWTAVLRPVKGML